MPLVPPTRLEYARLCARAAVHFSRDAAAQLAAGRYAGVIISCQHAWEAAGKSALAIEDPGFNFPPRRTTGPPWMFDHHVLSHIDSLCGRLVIKQHRKSLRLMLERLERWLPPSPRLPNPPVNSEYLHDAGATWNLPNDFFRASHARTATKALRTVLDLLKTEYRVELKGLSIK